MNKAELKEFLFKLTEKEIQSKYYLPSTRVDYPSDGFWENETGLRVFSSKYVSALKGAINRHKKSGPFLNNSSLLVVKHARYSYTPPHNHDFVEMSYVYSGNVDMVINNQRVHLNQGDFCLVDTGVIHQILNTGNSDILINFLIKQDYFSSQILSHLTSDSALAKFAVDVVSREKIHNQFIIFEAVNGEFMKDSVENVLSNFFDPSLFSKEVIDAYMIIIFSELLRSFKEKQSKYYNNNNQLFIGDVLEYIENKDGICSLAEVASHFNFNANYLSRYITHALGKSFITITQEIRFRNASILLRNSDLSIEEIIHKVGYNNINFFYKKFYKKFKELPSEYRNNYKKNLIVKNK